jgi:Response regulator containing a CheY-like receiver domain and an HTH DNA-binding domain
MKQNEILFFLSTLFFILAGLLYAWGQPSWFGLFPFSSGLRFLLSLEIYFLCCSVFFSFCLASFPGKKKNGFLKTFTISFIAIPVFSLLIFLGVPIQVLQSYAVGLDLVSWFSIMILAFRTAKRDRIIFSMLLALSGIILLVPAIPSILVICLRLFCLAVFSIEYFHSESRRGDTFPVQNPSDFCEIVNRCALSPRETEILALLVAGKTNNEIAEALFISLSTVKTHITSIFGKTGARNRLEVSALCKKT